MMAGRTGALKYFAPLALMLGATPAAAQDVQYETVTRIELPGALGTAMRIATRLGGGTTETVETTYIQGPRMRTDAAGGSTILDLDEGRVTMLDHEAKTYMSFTFAEMMARAEEASREMAPEGHTETSTGDAHRVDLRFEVEAANERQRVEGYDAERFFITMQMEGEITPEGGAERAQAGTLVLLTDLWVSKDVPAHQAMGGFEDASGQHYADSGSALMQALAAAFADEPGMRVAFERSAAEASKMEGMPMRTVTSFVSVTPEQRFSRELVLNPRTQPRESVAQQVGRAAVGRAMGRLPGRPQQPPQPEQQAELPSQITIMTVTSEVRNVSTRSLDAALFTVPAGYRETRIGSPAP